MLNAKSNSQSALDSTNLRKNFIWNTIGSTASAFVSLFYMMIITRLNGIDDAGIFSFAFSTTNIFLVIGVYSGRTFQVTDKNKKTTDSDYFYLKFVTCAVMLLVSLGFCLIRGYTGEKFVIIMFLAIARTLETIAECAYAVIQKNDRLYQVGRSMLMKSLGGLIGFFIIDYLTRNVTLSCVMIILAYLLPILFYDFPKLFKTDFHFRKFSGQKVRYLLQIGFFTFSFTFLNLYVINAARYAIDSMASDSAQTIYGVIAMPATVLSLIGQYLIQPFLTNFKKFFATDARQFQILVLKLCFALLGVGAVCIIAAWLLGIPVLELLYAIDLDGNLFSLILIIIGGIFSALVLVISTALVTMRHTRDQFWIYCIASLAAFGLSWILVKQSSVFGACLSYMLSMMLIFALYVIVFAYRLRELRRHPTQEVHRATEE